MKAAKSRARMVAVAVAALTLAGCGYTTNSPFPSDVASVDVPVWAVGKDVYRRGLEMRLTEAVKKRISLDTPYKIATKGTADTQLTGTIERIEQRVLSTNPDTGRPRELEITITVSFNWTDLRSGQVRKSCPDVRIAGTYIPPQPFSEDFFQGSEDVIDKLARRIVERMEADW